MYYYFINYKPNLRSSILDVVDSAGEFKAKSIDLYEVLSVDFL